MQFGELKLNPMNLEWLSKNQYIFYRSESFITQTRGESTDFPTSFIEFGHRMQKLQ